jgi:membrane protease YdiL (CAAX protease family)
MSPPKKWFAVACGFELLLGVLPAAGVWLLGADLPRGIWWHPPHALAGVLAAVPPLVLFYALLHTRRGALGATRSLLERFVRPIFSSWAIWQLAMISALAGLSEELMFRWMLQGWLAGWMGDLAALLIASALFGLAHCLTRTYALLAGLIGLYLGVLWILTGNLLAPVLTHAVYDFVALWYFLRAQTGSLPDTIPPHTNEP